MKDEWGPWIEHDGKGCPVDAGTWVQSEDGLGLVCEHAALTFIAYPDLPVEQGDAWTWMNYYNPTDIIRYRIRKPRGMAILESILADLPMPTERVTS